MRFLASIRRSICTSLALNSSWLNQVELWFAKIEQDVIARGAFTVPFTERESVYESLAFPSRAIL